MHLLLSKYKKLRKKKMTRLQSCGTAKETATSFWKALQLWSLVNLHNWLCAMPLLEGATVLPWQCCNAVVLRSYAMSLWVLWVKITEKKNSFKSQGDFYWLKKHPAAGLRAAKEMHNTCTNILKWLPHGSYASMLQTTSCMTKMCIALSDVLAFMTSLSAHQCSHKKR